MKILVISNMYPSDKDVVYGIFVKNFCDFIKTNIGDGKIDIIAIKGRDGSKLKKLWNYIKFYLQIFFACLICKHDLVYVHTISFPVIPLRLASFFRRIPLAFNIHGSDLISQTLLAATLKKFSYPLLRRAKMIVVPSSIFKEVLLSMLPTIRNDIIYVSPSGGVDTNLFFPDHHNNKNIVLGYVSHIEVKKGWRIFVETIEILCSKGYNVKGVMAGNGIEEQDLRDFLTSKGKFLNVKYLGAVAQKELPAVYNNMDLFLFPTLYFESLGLVGLEAMACGVPVVASNVGGPTEYVRDRENGFLFEQGNVEDLVEKVEHFIFLSDNEKTQLALNARQTAMNFDKERVMADLFQIILRTIL
jgi:glycosyltransferase involved in cell wall biosynthesis